MRKPPSKEEILSDKQWDCPWDIVPFTSDRSALTSVTYRHWKKASKVVCFKYIQVAAGLGYLAVKQECFLSSILTSLEISSVTEIKTMTFLRILGQIFGKSQRGNIPQNPPDPEYNAEPLVPRKDVWAGLGSDIQIDVFKFLRPYDVGKFCVNVNRNWLKFCVENRHYLPRPRILPRIDQGLVSIKGA
ncbi:hypothetical protein DdX_08372 [Ditylenchus destructor]|uniref:Uncharacterized protein n=1 Tax=Ditylenchus destructor TaxID=166010 RepID=A0AAD4R178_9BILA|nr:hypothetical protein DdX_08372 [Ditylenchus destructor]